MKNDVKKRLENKSKWTTCENKLIICIKIPWENAFEKMSKKRKIHENKWLVKKNHM